MTGRKTTPPGPSKSNPVGRNALFKRVKTAKGRDISSTAWIERHINDPYVQRARLEGYRARSAYKLLEMDEKHRFLRNAATIIDLGAAPGGWSQIIRQNSGRGKAASTVIALDILPMEPIDGVQIIQADFMCESGREQLEEALSGLQPDLILSDIAAATTGHRKTDHLRTLLLFETVLDFAELNLCAGGSLLAKMFQGGTERALLERMRRNFRKIRHLKPPASRKASPELYVLAEGFRGTDISADQP